MISVEKDQTTPVITYTLITQIIIITTDVELRAERNHSAAPIESK